MNYHLNVEIDPSIIPTLKDSGYKLCIAKKVNDKYTVVWQGKDVLFQNAFQWSSQYRVFGTTNPFSPGYLVQATTEKQDIKSGQTAVLDKYGRMLPAGGPVDKTGTFHVDNQYQLINIGVDSQVNGSWSPIYVSDQGVYTGKTDLTPVEKVMVWFDTELTTGSMMLKASTKAIELDFTGKTSYRIQYTVPAGAPPGKGVWIIEGSQIVLPSTYSIETHNFSIDEPSNEVLNLMTEFMNDRSKFCPRPPALYDLMVYARAGWWNEDDAKSFAEYALSHPGDCEPSWAVSLDGSTVTVSMGVEIYLNPAVVIKHMQDAYLDVLATFPGRMFSSLNFEVVHRGGSGCFPVDAVNNSESEPGGKTNGTAIVRFSTVSNAAAFADDINATSSSDVSCEATATGVVVTVRFSAQHPGTDVKAEREKVQKIYSDVTEAYRRKGYRDDPTSVGLIHWDED